MLYLDGLRNDLIMELVDLLGKLNPVEVVTPINAAEMKSRWIKDVTEQEVFTNPYFRYDREYLSTIASYQNTLMMIKHHLLWHVVPENKVELALLDILSTRIEQGIMTTELASSIYLQDDTRSSEMSCFIYGVPSPLMIAECYDLVNNKVSREPIPSRFTKDERTRLKAMSFDAEAIKHWFTKALEHYQIPLDNWTIEVGDQYTSIDVRTKNSTGHPVIGIPTDRKVNGLKLLELIGHEIACHLRSAENARDLFLQLLGEDSPLAPLALVLAKSDDELLDEGSAKMSDVSVNGESALPTPYYNIAIDLARHGYMFRGVAEALYNLRIANGSTPESAAKLSWTNTYRVFRGSTRPDCRGYAFTKDHIYYVGYSIAKKSDPIYLGYASMGLDELQLLLRVVDPKMMRCKYPNLDVVNYVKDELLSPKG